MTSLFSEKVSIPAEKDLPRSYFLAGQTAAVRGSQLPAGKSTRMEPHPQRSRHTEKIALLRLPLFCQSNKTPDPTHRNPAHSDFGLPDGSDTQSDRPPAKTPARWVRDISVIMGIGKALSGDPNPSSRWLRQDRRWGAILSGSPG